MPAYLRPPRSLSLENLRFHNASRLPLAVMETLAAAGALDKQELLAPKAPGSYSQSGLPTCALTEVLANRSEAVAETSPTPEQLVQARTGAVIKDGPRMDERIWLWALDGQRLDPLLQANLVLAAVERKMPWGLSGLLHGWAPELTPELRKALKSALGKAMESDEPGVIAPLIAHALEHRWTDPLDRLVRDAKGTRGAQAVIEAVDVYSNPEAAKTLWEDWARQWHFDIALTLGVVRSSPAQGRYLERALLENRVSTALLPWALNRLKAHPDRATALGLTMVARLMTADNSEFKAVVAEYAQHWNKNGWAPDQHLMRGLAGTFMTMPLLKDAPGRRMHRMFLLAEALEKYTIGTHEQRRHVHAQLHWLHLALLPSLKDDFHRYRLKELSEKLAFSTEERLMALESLIGEAFKPVNANNVSFQPVSAPSVALAALTWSMHAQMDSQQRGRTWAAASAILSNSQAQLRLDAENGLAPSDWNAWLQHVSAQVNDKAIEATHLLAPLLDLSLLLSPAVRIKPSDLDEVWSRALDPHDSTQDTRITLVRTLRMLVEAGGQYPEELCDGHWASAFHPIFKQAALEARLPSPKAPRPMLRF